MKIFGLVRPTFTSFQRVPDNSDSLLRCAEEPHEYEDVQPHRLMYDKRPSFGTQVFRLSTMTLLLYISAVLTIKTISSKTGNSSVEMNPQYIPESLAKDVLLHEWRKEWKVDDAPFNLHPSDELDQAWDDLLRGLNIHVTSQEMDLLDANTTNRLRFTNENYVGVLGVYHHLHCLDLLRRSIHSDYYEPITSEASIRGGENTMAHLDHCIDMIRQKVMCHPSLDTYTVEWKNKHTSDLKHNLRTTSKSRCANWEALDAWARSRARVRGRDKFQIGPFGLDLSGKGEQSF